MRHALLFGLTTLALAGCGPRTPPEPLLVGHLASLSGVDRVEGERSKQAVLLAVKQTNQDPINGHKIQVLHVDTRGKSDLAYAEAVRLVTVNRVVGLMSGDDFSQAAAAAPAGNPHQVPTLTAAPIPLLPGNPGLFSINASPDFHGQILARFATEQLKAGRAVVVVEEADPLSPVVADAVRGHWPNKDGGAVTLVPLGSDPRPVEIGARLENMQADVVVFAGSAETFNKLRPHLKPSRKETPILFAGPPQEWRKLLASHEGGTAPVYAAVLYPPAENATEQQKNFARDYHNEFKADPTPEAFEAYEMARVLFEGLRQTKGSVAKLREELGKLENVAGVTGPISIKDQHARRPLHVVRLADRELKLAQSYDP